MHELKYVGDLTMRRQVIFQLIYSEKQNCPTTDSWCVLTTCFSVFDLWYLHDNNTISVRYGRRSCFWEFTRHLDRLDVLLLTRVSQDNLFGVKSFLQRKLETNIHPEITYAFFNHTTTAIKDQECDSSSLSVSLTEEASLGGYSVQTDSQ